MSSDLNFKDKSNKPELDYDKFAASLADLKNTLLKTMEDDDEYTDIQDHQLDEDDLGGMSVVDDPLDEEDDAAKWLKENESAEQEGETSEEGQEERQADPASQKRGKSTFAQWQPLTDLHPEKEAKVNEFISQGHTRREAEHLADLHPEMDFQSALKSNVWPDDHSDAHIEKLKPLVAQWIDNKKRLDEIEADPEKNPVKFASGRLRVAHEDHTKDYNKALHDFMSSDDVKQLTGRQRHQAVRDWKNKWKTENPEYHDNLKNVSEAQTHFKDIDKQTKTNIEDRLRRISGAGAMPVSMSTEEAAQHVGGIKTEHGSQAATVRDPLAALGAANPKLREQAVKDLHSLIGKHGTPEQQERFKRVTSARSVIRRPGGGGGGGTSSPPAAPAAPTSSGSDKV
jgi:hypothetical protein